MVNVTTQLSAKMETPYGEYRLPSSFVFLLPIRNSVRKARRLWAELYNERMSVRLAILRHRHPGPKCSDGA